MSFRADVSVDWTASPRIITVAAPSTEINMQDLYDTLRILESSIEAMDEAPIVAGAGKENLGGGVLVGLTITLLNAQLAFEARSGPDYVQCRVSGGNLVAIDDVGGDISSIYPTAFTQIILANSSSATLQEQEAIQFASFNGGVTYDETSPYSGTEYPIGTPQAPVNNVYDAQAIATERGFTTGYIIGDLTMPTDLPLSHFTFIGEGISRTLITIPDAADVSECTYLDAEVTGYLDGANTLRDCRITNLYYINGYIEQCVLEPGTITLAGTADSHFLDCWSGQPGLGTPTIDMGDTGQALGIRNYNGGVKLQNKSGPESVSIDLNSGQVIVDDTVTNGTIVLRGVGTWTNKDTYTGGANVVDQLIEGTDIKDIHAAHFNKRVWDKVGNTITLYDKDGVTPLYIFDTNSDMSIIAPSGTDMFATFSGDILEIIG